MEFIEYIYLIFKLWIYLTPFENLNCEITRNNFLRIIHQLFLCNFDHNSIIKVKFNSVGNLSISRKINIWYIWCLVKSHTCFEIISCFWFETKFEYELYL